MNERYEKFRKKVVDILDRERPADRRDLQKVKAWKHPDHPGILIRYFPFSLWLYRFDDQMKRDFPVNINSYLSQREKHKDDVGEQLSGIQDSDSGRALFDEIKATGKKLHIYPYWRFGRTKLCNKEINEYFGELGQNATAQQFGDIDDDDRSDSLIMFTPSMWGERRTDPKTLLSTGTAGYSGPATGPDDVLFHEMVHGTRRMRGVTDRTEVGEGYDNVEEFLAVVVTNIFGAEKGQHELRANHQSHDALKDPKRFLENKKHVDLLLQFRSRQPDFFRNLACIPKTVAWWNPMRELAREMGINCGAARGGAAAPKGAGARGH